MLATRNAPLENSLQFDHDIPMLNQRQNRRLTRRFPIEGLQQFHMENIMKTNPCWQNQSVRHLPNAFADLEWPKEPRTQLPTALHIKGRHRPM
jgi:hypothetical protein